LGALAGVAEVKFDCKTATVTMKGDATLAPESAEKALHDAGFPMKSFSGGPPPSLPVLRALVRTKAGLPPSAAVLARLEGDLARELSAAAGLADITDLSVEPDGRLTAQGKADAKLDAAALSSALATRGLVAGEVETRAWPRTATAYSATLRGPTDAAAVAKARAAIEAIDNVVAAIACADGPWRIVTREPCANVETRLRAALRAAGFELAEVKPR